MSISYADLINKTVDHCQEKSTGCTIYLSNESLSGKIFIKTGEIVSIEYGGTSGIASIPLMVGIKTVNYEFKGLPVIIKPNADFPDTKSLLDALTQRRVDLLRTPNKQGASEAVVSSLSTSITSIPTPVSTVIALPVEQRMIIKNCLMQIVGPMAELLADEHVENASSVNEALSGLRNDIDEDSYQQLCKAVTQALK